MKLIAVLIGIGTIILVIALYEILKKLFEREEKNVKQLQNEAWEEYFKDKGGLKEVLKATEERLKEEEKEVVEELKNKINDIKQEPKQKTE